MNFWRKKMANHCVAAL